MCTDIDLEDLLDVPVVILQEIQQRLDEAAQRIAARETPVGGVSPSSTAISVRLASLGTSVTCAA